MLRKFAQNLNKTKTTFSRRFYETSPSQHLNRNFFISDETQVLQIKQNMPAFVKGFDGKLFPRKKGSLIFNFKMKESNESFFFPLTVENTATLVLDKDEYVFKWQSHKDENLAKKLTIKKSDTFLTATLEKKVSESSEYQLESKINFSKTDFLRLKILIEDAIPRMYGWRIDEPPVIVPMA
ncbi:hypothetical protein MHBO_004296 [Bonamia ostreae]|uniref:Uncharacterized protein n=1 Tax=Bonamia ostreae TaxID=126728 RepID=A0ABV2ASZ5_9EUKA